MKIIDPGHFYHLTALDGPEGSFETLQFVKREGDGYPGNVGTQKGTTTQEVLRALIERTEYVDTQIHDSSNDVVLSCLREAIWQLEYRAARRHGRPVNFVVGGIEHLPTCDKCNHIGCEGECREHERTMERD